ncbi:NADH-dependent flavin oxidoreductase [Amphibacillus sp. MSJ-3]|uniref:NADH-dependent flavin oxidoreductase n=1 Tax=Amphibacillus sp. MSJ-3 TaxID=2841505 RepID=UPI001C0ECE9B|nr:NADH-dependent flavin oxidoreductase [Amphibacillus sp. MSJ-3]MBU5594316.1 NADH-dependent flavin oxidoreductase [Amphibacillus sp. MSJ-3]
MKEKYKPLFEPFTFKSGVTIDNRIVMAPMTTNSAFENGMVTTDEHNYYKRRTKGLGAVITSCAQVREDGKFAGSLSAASDMHIESLAKLADTIKSTGTKAILQIFHVGRMGSARTLRGLQPVSASAIAAMRENAEIPRALADEEIHDIIEAFGQATRRAILAGFDGVEIHGANTYLIQQFFSPHSNQRDDHWGGTLEKRMNFPLAVVDSVKAAIKKHADRPFILGYRISPEEIEEPGITLDDTLALLRELKEKELDYIHISTGHYLQSSIRNSEDQTPVLKAIVETVGADTPIIGVGQIITPDDAISAIEELNLPLLAIGRELIVEPDWIIKVKTGKESTIRTEIHLEDRADLAFPDAMWEYIQTRPGWLPIVK